MGRNTTVFCLKSIPKSNRANIVRLELAESNRDWKQCLELSKEIAEDYIDTEDGGKAIKYAEKYLSYTKRLYGKATFASNKLLYEVGKVAGNHESVTTFGQLILPLVKDPEDQYELLMQLGISFVAKAYSYQSDEKQKDQAKALEYFRKVADMLKNDSRLSRVVLKKGYLAMNSGILEKHKRNYQSALNAFTKANSIADKLADLNLKIGVLTNLSYLYEDQGKLDLAIKYGRQALDFRKKDSRLEVKDYVVNVKSLVAQYSLLGQFSDARLLVEDALTRLKGIIELDELKKLRSSLSDNMNALKRIDTVLTPQIKESRDTKNYRKLYLSLGDRGKERLSLNLVKGAIEDFEEQRLIGENQCKYSGAQLSQVYANLGRACHLANRLEDSEKYFRRSLKPFNGTSIENYEILKAIFGIMEVKNFKTDINNIKMILDNMQRIAEDDLMDYEKQKEVVQSRIIVANHFGHRDTLRVLEAQERRLDALMPASVPDSLPDSDEEDGYVDPVELSPVKVIKKKPVMSERTRNKAKFMTLDDTAASPVVSPVRKKKNPVVVESSQESESFLDDYQKPPKKAKRNLISSSVTDDMEEQEIFKSVNRPRSDFEQDLKEHDMYHSFNDQITDVSEKIIEVSGQGDEPIHTVEEMIPATPFFSSNPVEHMFDDDDEAVTAFDEPEIIQVSDLTPKKPKSPIGKDSRGAEASPETPRATNKSPRESSSSPIEMVAGTPIKLKEAISTDETPFVPQPSVLNSNHEPTTPSQTNATVLFSEVPTVTPKLHSRASLSIQPPPQRDRPHVELPVPKVMVEYQTPEKKSKKSFLIPYNDGPNGTPKTVNWLIYETNLRYKERHHADSPFKELLLDGQQLCVRDPLKHILEPNTNLNAQ